MTGKDSAGRAGIITKLSPWPAAETVPRLTGMIAEKGMKLFAVIDQSAEAAQAGLRLRGHNSGDLRQPGRWHPRHGGLAAGRARPAAEGLDLG